LKCLKLPPPATGGTVRRAVARHALGVVAPCDLAFDWRGGKAAGRSLRYSTNRSVRRCANRAAR